MKKSNEMIEIGGSEFVVDEKAADLLNEYLAKITKKFRWKPKTRKELIQALRDVLIERQSKKTGSISVKTAEEAIDITGESYDSGEKSRLQRRILQIREKLENIVKKTILTESFRKKMYTFFGFFLLIPLGLMISSFPIFLPDHNELYGQMNDQQGIITTIGDVVLGDYAYYQAASPNRQITSDTIVDYSGALVFAAASLTMFALAQRSKHLKMYLGLLVLSIIVNFGILENRSLNSGFESFAEQRLTVDFTTSNREINDYDTLLACGTEINYVMSGRDAGKLFYGLKDQGFTLVSELETKSFYEVPSPQQICSTYDTLRQTNSDNAIVLQTFVRDEQGALRPWDLNERNTRSAESQKELKLRYGFFVRK